MGGNPHSPFADGKTAGYDGIGACAQMGQRSNLPLRLNIDLYPVER